MMSKEVYIVNMLRFGNKEAHSYIHGVFTKKHQAKKAGLAEEYYRGGKYDAEIIVLTLDSHDKDAIDNMNKRCGGYDEGSAKKIPIIKKPEA